MTNREYDQRDAEDESAEWRHGRRYRQELYKHPDCRDPDHPGCKYCSGEEDDDNPEDQG